MKGLKICLNILQYWGTSRFASITTISDRHFFSFCVNELARSSMYLRMNLFVEIVVTAVLDLEEASAGILEENTYSRKFEENLCG